MPQYFRSNLAIYVRLLFQRWIYLPFWEVRIRDLGQLPATWKIKVYLKITITSEDLATLVIETAIECASEPAVLKQHRVAGSDEPVFSVYIKGTQAKLDACRKAIVKEKYYRSELFTFRVALAMATLAGESED